MSVGIHQVLAGAAPRDAITNHALLARGVIRSMGCRSEIFVDSGHLSRELPGDILPHDAWARIATPQDRAILHYSIDSPAFEHVLARTEVSAIHYHNVTPAELLWRDAPHIAWDCLKGRQELAALAQHVGRAGADSGYNAEELVALGFPDPTVIGILRRPGSMHAMASGNAKRRDARRPRLLFVGRGAPNKCQHDLILATAALADCGVHADLRLIGSWGGNAAYRDRCERLARECGVSPRVHILGSVDDDRMDEEFRNADVFLCLSEHEGYGVPLAQAIEAGIPIVAYAAGAVPETVGGAGLLLNDKSPSMVAEAILAVLAGDVDERMARGRAEQRERHAPRVVEGRLREFVEGLIQC